MTSSVFKQYSHLKVLSKLGQTHNWIKLYRNDYSGITNNAYTHSLWHHSHKMQLLLVQHSSSLLSTLVGESLRKTLIDVSQQTFCVHMAMYKQQSSTMWITIVAWVTEIISFLTMVVLSWLVLVVLSYAYFRDAY